MHYLDLLWMKYSNMCSLVSWCYTVWVDTLWCVWHAVLCLPRDAADDIRFIVGEKCWHLYQPLRGMLGGTFILEDIRKHHLMDHTAQYASEAFVGSNRGSLFLPQITAAHAHEIQRQMLIERERFPHLAPGGPFRPEYGHGRWIEPPVGSSSCCEWLPTSRPCEVPGITAASVTNSVGTCGDRESKECHYLWCISNGIMDYERQGCVPIPHISFL